MLTSRAEAAQRRVRLVDRFIVISRFAGSISSRLVVHRPATATFRHGTFVDDHNT
jgi:hypothetical protein